MTKLYGQPGRLFFGLQPMIPDSSQVMVELRMKIWNGHKHCREKIISENPRKQVTETVVKYILSLEISG